MQNSMLCCNKCSDRVKHRTLQESIGGDVWLRGIKGYEKEIFRGKVTLNLNVCQIEVQVGRRKAISVRTTCTKDGERGKSTCIQ